MKLSFGRMKIRTSDLLGLTGARWARRSPGLYVFTFHRIGDARTSAYDPNVFSCSSDEFSDVIDFLQREFDVLGLDDLRDFENGDSPSARAALITFDDGYIDNFEIAMPQLRERGLTATFFIATSMADGQLPWWDTLAWWARHASTKRLRLNGELIDLRGDPPGAIRPLLRAFKEDRGSIADKLERYHSILAPEADVPETRLVMNWDQLKAAVAAGFTVGSHTVNHPILSHLGEAEQKDELARSKSILEQRLGNVVNAVAFPVGGETAFTSETVRLAREAGYEYAFTSVAGLNRWEPLERGCLKRIAIDSGDLSELRYRVAGLT